MKTRNNIDNQDKTKMYNKEILIERWPSMWLHFGDISEKMILKNIMYMQTPKIQWIRPIQNLG